MVEAKFYTDKQGVVRKFDFSGHAGYAEHGLDIVCSASSAISQTVIGTLDELLKKKPDYHIDPQSGRIVCCIPDYYNYGKTEQIVIGALMYSALIGMKQLEPNYGDYVKVEELEYLED
ncbi:MAG: ribosomal-processing cysteine protease Prp [Eubacteriales bacterium]|nr:ribosomal-processing cysteine protease Prp [Eubacteriales bacterium]